MRLDELSAGLGARIARGDGGTEIADVAFDSRRVVPGTLFVCVTGETADGHDFAPAAVGAGASALVVERELDLRVPQVVVADSRAAMAPLAARLFSDPSRELVTVAVTGTNGKTTTTFLVRAILEDAGLPCGLLGTVKQVVGGVEEPVERTTPEAIDLQRTLRRMVDGGDRACVMEVSSHALVLGRADAIDFDVAAFTNLTQEHLDFHADMADYFAAKRLLFAPAAGSGGILPGAAAINVDDPYGARLAAELRERGTPPVVAFSASGSDAAELSAHAIESDASGVRFEVRCGGEPLRVELGLPGLFNVENALAALAATTQAGIGLDEAVAALARAEPAPGRMEPIDGGQPFGVLVDYAHTPDSLVNVLTSARGLTSGGLICVFGCGGDRDRSKRAPMGRAVAELADVAILTSDNPRSEEPGAIIAEVLDGIDEVHRRKVRVEPDRRAAIALGCAEAVSGDLLVIAGKGHEQGQELEGGRKIPFDDREVAREELAALAGASTQ